VNTGRQLAKNSTINLLGQGLPLLVAIYAMPKILRNLGDERLGILALVWMFIGYFTLFDLGLGRAVTKELSYWLLKDRNKAVEVFWTGAVSTLLLGILAGLVLFGLTPVLVDKFLKIPDLLKEETRASFFAIAMSLPFVISTVSLRGTLESQGHFLSINLVQIPLGILNYLVPMIISEREPNLGLIVDYLIGARIASWFVFAIIVWRLFPGGLAAPRFRINQLRELLSFGGWITVSNIVTPLMGYADRLLVGSMLTTAAVAYYSTPYEMITKLWIIPGAIIGALFPALASLDHDQKEKLNDLLLGGAKVVFFIMFPLGFLLSTFSQEILALWLGEAFASASWKILWWFSLAIIINSVGFAPSAFLQSRGRPDIPAKLVAIGLPIYITVLLVLLNNVGIEGAAITWFLRTVIEVTFLFYYSFKIVDRNFSITSRYAFLAVLPIGAFITAVSLQTFSMKMGFFLFVTAGFVLMSWKQMFNERERNWIRSLVQIKK
jgi:O-antigen/teichoic acid export membrane protein